VPLQLLYLVKRRKIRQLIYLRYKEDVTDEEMDAFEGLRLFLAAIPSIICPGVTGDGTCGRRLEPELIEIEQTYGGKQAVLYVCTCHWRQEVPIEMMLT